VDEKNFLGEVAVAPDDRQSTLWLCRSMAGVAVVMAARCWLVGVSLVMPMMGLVASSSSLTTHRPDDRCTTDDTVVTRGFSQVLRPLHGHEMSDLHH
jgi:hypothetical protein